jgi:hypothetical protein
MTTDSAVCGGVTPEIDWTEGSEVGMETHPEGSQRNRLKTAEREPASRTNLQPAQMYPLPGETEASAPGHLSATKNPVGSASPPGFL